MQQGEEEKTNEDPDLVLLTTRKRDSDFCSGVVLLGGTSKSNAKWVENPSEGVFVELTDKHQQC